MEASVAMGTPATSLLVTRLSESREENWLVVARTMLWSSTHKMEQAVSLTQHLEEDRLLTFLNKASISLTYQEHFAPLILVQMLLVS